LGAELELQLPADVRRRLVALKSVAESATEIGTVDEADDRLELRGIDRCGARCSVLRDG
jgi:hypothetical protein